MSRQLPPRANLEFLRKEAKARLRELLSMRPDAQLADVQHALAREYGFASWPRLMAHVQPHVPITPSATRWSTRAAARSVA